MEQATNQNGHLEPLYNKAEDKAQAFNRHASSGHHSEEQKHLSIFWGRKGARVK